MERVETRSSASANEGERRRRQLLKRNLLSAHSIIQDSGSGGFHELIVNKGSLHPQVLWDMIGEGSKRRH